MEIKTKVVAAFGCLGALTLFLASGTSAQVGFRRISFPVGMDPRGVVVGDFNRDGHPDIAVANRGSNTVSVLLGKGDGSFFAGASLATGPQPAAIAAGDFDGDSNLDLVTADEGTSFVSVFLGKGDGSYQARIGVATDSAPARVLAGDFNNDGFADIVVWSPSLLVSVQLSNGNGTFAGTMNVTSRPQGLVAADFDGDGKLDLTISTHPDLETFTELRLLRGRGDGTFSPSFFLDGLGNVGGMSVGDFNSDGKLDLAIVLPQFGVFGSSGLETFLGNGQGGFGSPTFKILDAPPVGLVAGLFDTDEHQDIVTVAGELTCDFFADLSCPESGLIPPHVAVFRGIGNGTFVFTIDSELASVQPTAIASGDFNGDGRIDLVVTDTASDQVVVLLQAPALSFNKNLSFSNFQPVGVATEPIEVRFKSTGSFAASLGLASLGGADTGMFNIVSDACSGTVLPIGSECAIQASFLPTSLGPRSAVLAVPVSSAGEPFEVVLSGVGVPNAPQVSLSPSSLSFGSQLVGGPSKFDFVRLASTGGANLTVTSVVIEDPNNEFAIDPGPADCSTSAFSLVPGNSCSVRIRFTPSGTGNRSAQLRISSDSTGGTETVPLSGTGVNLSITPAPGFTESATIRSGELASFDLQFSAGNATPLLNLRCDHSIPGGQCILPVLLQLSGTGPVTAKIQVVTLRGSLLPTGPGTGSNRQRTRPLVYVLLALALLQVLRRFRGPWRLSPAVGTLIVAGVLMSGCGGGSPPPSVQRGTPPGSYNVTVTATTGSVTQAVTLNVKVQ